MQPPSGKLHQFQRLDPVVIYFHAFTLSCSFDLKHSCSCALAPRNQNCVKSIETSLIQRTFLARERERERERKRERVIRINRFISLSIDFVVFPSTL